MAATDCPHAKGCDCNCKRNKYVSCFFAKAGDAQSSHCGDHSQCHANCAPPADQKPVPITKKPSPKPLGRIGRTSNLQGGSGKCSCKCKDCKKNVHCFFTPECLNK